MAALALHILDVFQMRSEPQVLRINAFSVVARVKDIHTRRDFGAYRSEHRSMSIVAFVNPHRHAAIARSMPTAAPLPASRRDFFATLLEPNRDRSLALHLAPRALKTDTHLGAYGK